MSRVVIYPIDVTQDDAFVAAMQDDSFDPLVTHHFVQDRSGYLRGKVIIYDKPMFEPSVIPPTLMSDQDKNRHFLIPRSPTDFA